MTVKELFAKLGLDVDAASFFEGEALFKLVEKAGEAFGEVMEKVSEALEEAVVGTAEEAHHLELLSKQTGLSTKALQELGYAGSQTGLTTEDMAQSIGFLSRTVRSMSEGNQQAAFAFGQVGVSAYKSNGQLKDADELLGDLADRFSKMPDGLQKTGLAMQLFGRAGKQMIPLLDKGRAGIGALREEAHQLGVVMDEETIESGSEFSQTLISLKAAATGLARTFGGPLLKPLGDVAKEFLEWVKANRELIKQRVEQVANLVAKAFRGLASVVKFVVENFRFLAIVAGSILVPILWSMIPALVEAVSWYVALGIQAVLTGEEAAVSWLAAAAPLALIVALIAAIALAAGDVYTFLQGGDSVIGTIGVKWTKFLDDFSKPQAGDPWWMKLIREFVAAITDIPGTFGYIIDDLKKQIGELVIAAKAAGKEIVSGLTGGIYNPGGGPPTEGQSVFRGLGGSLLGAIVPGGGLLGAGAGAVSGLFGGGASPAATASPAGSGRTVVQNNAPTINIHQQPGQDSRQLAQHVGQELDEHHRRAAQELAASTH